MTKPKVALLFWGLTRGLKYTYDSFLNKVLIPLQDKYHVHIFLHTYFFEGKYSNERHGVSDVILDFNEYKLLNPNFFIIEDQDKIKPTLELQKYRTFYDPFKNNYQSIDNYILSMHSQSKVTNLFWEKKDDYEYCMFIRPDVYFPRKFNVEWLSLARDNKMVLLDWKTYKNVAPYSENDRFCICKPNDAKKYGDILPFLLLYSKQKAVIAESFLGYMLNEYYKIEIERISFYFKRVLPDGQMDKLDR